MTTNWQNDVNEFRRKFGFKNECIPNADIGDDEKQFHIALIKEETMELIDALLANDIAEVADGGVDSLYVILGLMCKCGINVQPVWDLVHPANMRKEGGGTRGDGKILKPPGWTHPDMQAELDRQSDG